MVATSHAQAVHRYGTTSQSTCWRYGTVTAAPVFPAPSDLTRSPAVAMAATPLCPVPPRPPSHAHRQRTAINMAERGYSANGSRSTGGWQVQGTIQAPSLSHSPPSGAAVHGPAVAMGCWDGVTTLVFFNTIHVEERSGGLGGEKRRRRWRQDTSRSSTDAHATSCAWRGRLWSRCCNRALLWA